MATVVRHKQTNKRYVVLGAGFAMHDDPVMSSNKRRHAGVCVCDAEGVIGWFSSSDLIVETVFGQSPADVLE